MRDYMNWLQLNRSRFHAETDSQIDTGNDAAAQVHQPADHPRRQRNFRRLLRLHDFLNLQYVNAEELAIQIKRAKLPHFA
jgi:hypothetical protein